jgi:TolB-like protein/Tfp pilus assembly protein PilF
MSYFDELKRRNVFRVGTAYVITAWLALQVASILLPTFNSPDWVMQAFTILLFLGFPLALVLAWAFELTPAGVRRDGAVGREERSPPASRRRLDYFIVAALSAALVFVIIDQYVLEEQTDRSSEAVTAGEAGHSIAVLPFRNRSAVAEDAYFVDGIHDDILTQLSKLSFLDKVISRTTAERYRDTDKSMTQIGFELGVANILEGGVQRAGDRVRINVQLIDVASDEHLWAETYDRELTPASIFAIQTEIAAAIAAAMRTTLSPEEQHGLSAIPTESLEAYEAWQLGKQQYARRTTAGTEAAIDHFEQATRYDGDFALAWASLANAHLMLAELSGQHTEQRYARAARAAQRAMDLDEQSAETQIALANLLLARRELPAADRAIDRALRVSPNHAYAHLIKAEVLYESGQPDAALPYYETAVHLDPLSPVMNDAYAFRLSEVGRFDEALARYRKVDEIEPDYPGTAVSIGTIYGLSYGRLDLANLWYRKALAQDPGNPWMSALLGLVHIELNNDVTAEFWISRSLQQAPQYPWANGSMTMLQSYREDNELIREYAERVLAVDRRWRFGTALSHGRVPDLRAGNYQAILDRYESAFPELFRDTPDVNYGNFRPAIDVAGLFLLTGDTSRADELLGLCEIQVSNTIRVGIFGFWVSDVQIYALQGRTDDALRALRQAFDQSWVTDWRYFAYVDPNLDSIRGEPEFQAIMQEIAAKMALQLERARQMEADGELTPIPSIGERAGRSN